MCLRFIDRPGKVRFVFRDFLISYTGRKTKGSISKARKAGGGDARSKFSTCCSHACSGLRVTGRRQPITVGTRTRARFSIAFAQAILLRLYDAMRPCWSKVLVRGWRACTFPTW